MVYKKIYICLLVSSCLFLTACQSSQQSKKEKSESREESSLVKENSKLRKSISKSSSSNASKDKSQSTNEDNNVQSQDTPNNTTAKSAVATAKTQGEINRERGYDPNGNPLLPGQDHAAGSNPDGSPDAWVQWQIDHQNDTTFPDGTPFPNSGNANN